MIFTTLFDSFYIDKGIALYRSLERVCEDFSIYIYAFDEKSYVILNDLHFAHATVLRKEDLESAYPILHKLKEERSKAEYCWTCTPLSVEYVLDTFDVESCTYIDSDLYFFSNPKVLFDEVTKTGDNVIITPHRFADSFNDRRLCKRSGKYCVEFNYFDQSERSRQVLTWWKERCLEWCYHLYEPERMGDQKYLEKFPILFDGVHELIHLGGGVAPWNLAQYESDTDSSQLVLRQKGQVGTSFDLIFYHFQNIRYISKNVVNISSDTHDRSLKRKIYIPYLREIEDIRKKLADEYGLSFDVKKKYSSNKLIAFLQGTILRFKIKSLSDIIHLDRI